MNERYAITHITSDFENEEASESILLNIPNTDS